MRGGSESCSFFVFVFVLAGRLWDDRADYECSPGQDIVRSVAGPMSCSLATIERYMESLPCASPWKLDQHTAPVPWRRSLASLRARRLKIAFVVDDGVVKVQPPIARAVRDVVAALKAAGHEGMSLSLSEMEFPAISDHVPSSV